MTANRALGSIAEDDPPLDIDGDAVRFSADGDSSQRPFRPPQRFPPFNSTNHKEPSGAKAGPSGNARSSAKICGVLVFMGQSIQREVWWRDRFGCDGTPRYWVAAKRSPSPTWWIGKNFRSACLANLLATPRHARVGHRRPHRCAFGNPRR